MSRLLLMAFVSAVLAACGGSEGGGGSGGGAGGAAGAGGSGGTGGDSGSGGGGPIKVARVDITPSPASVAEGQEVQLTAAAFDEDGEPIAIDRFNWSSTDPALATVSQTGVVTGKMAGEVMIDAEAGGKRGSTRVIVEPAPAFEVRISPDDAEVTVGFEQVFTAALYDEDGRKVEGHGDPVWSLADEELATIDDAGVFKGSMPGKVEVRASIDGHEGAIVVPVVLRFAQVVVGGYHACGRTLLGEAWCWGQGFHGQLGAGELGDMAFSSVPLKVESDEAFTSLAAGAYHTCGNTASGEVHCWGRNDEGQIGYESLTVSFSPVLVPFLPSGAVVGSLALEGNASCALTRDSDSVSGGIVWCWGSVVGSKAPRELVFTQRFRDVDIGGAHVCAIGRSAGTSDLYCWGKNADGQADPDQPGDDVAEPLRLGEIEGTIYAVGGSHTCAKFKDGKTRCWGNGQSGQIGAGEVVDSAPMTEVSGDHAFTALWASGTQTCGVDAEGAWCWGMNRKGALGLGVDGGTTPVTEPSRVAGVSFTSIAPGEQMSCGIGTDSLVYCWGSNELGQLGGGVRIPSALEPLLVSGQTGDGMVEE